MCALPPMSGRFAGWIEEWAWAWSLGVHANWAVVEAGSGELAGRVSLKDIALPAGRAGAAYWTVPRLAAGLSHRARSPL